MMRQLEELLEELPILTTNQSGIYPSSPIFNFSIKINRKNRLP